MKRVEYTTCSRAITQKLHELCRDSEMTEQDAKQYREELLSELEKRKRYTPKHNPDRIIYAQRNHLYRRKRKIVCLLTDQHAYLVRLNNKCNNLMLRADSCLSQLQQYITVCDYCHTVLSGHASRL